MNLQTLLGRAIDLFYRPWVARFVPHDLFRYAACGGFNMLLDACFYFLIYHYVVALRYIDLGVVVISPHIASLILVFPVTFFNGFWLNRHVAFRSTALRSRTQLLRYLLTVCGSILLNYLLMKLFVEGLHIWATPSKLLTTLICALYSFLAAKFYTFRQA